MVDDEPRNLVALEAALESVNCTLVKAHSGLDALMCVLSEDFAVIVLDVHMPDMDGFETARLIRARDRSKLTPIIFVTADDRAGARMLEGYSFGAVDYLYKPFEPEVLRSKVGIFVELFRKTVALEAAVREVSALNAGIVQSQQTLTAIMASMSDGLLLLGEGQIITYCNPRAGELLHVDSQALVGRVFGEMLDETPFSMNGQPAAALWATAVERLHERPTLELEATVPAKCDLQLLPFSVHRGADRAGMMDIGLMVHDVTAARAMSRTKDELLSVVSHELRTPLASLVGFSELLMTREYNPEKRQEFLRVINHEGKRLTALVTDFLDLQRLESGDQSTILVANSLSAIVERAVAVAGEDLERPITLDLPATLPEVQGDADKLLQVLTNLLSNARKYSPAGGDICVRARVDGPVVRVEVADHGLGIPADALPHVFDKFYRVDNSDRRAIAGTGLGLAICHQIVAAHGGAIGVESAGLGKGSCFWLTLVVSCPNPPSYATHATHEPHVMDAVHTMQGGTR